MVKVSIYPDSKLKKKLEDKAKKEGRSLNNFILRILTNSLNQHKED